MADEEIERGLGGARKARTPASKTFVKPAGAVRPKARPEVATSELEGMREDFNTPLAAAGADKGVWQGETDELGRKVYVAPSGRKFYVGNTTPSKSLPEVAGDVYEAIPPVEDWRLPSADEVVSAGKALVGGAVEGAKKVIEAPTNPDATVGDMMGVVGSMPLGVGAAAGVKAPEGAIGIFAGESAVKANLKNLKLAKDLRDEGWKPEDIWKLTGWAKAPDDRWVFEIDDSQFEMNPHFQIKPGYDAVRGNAGTTTSHPELYDNYPDLKNTSVRKLSDRAANRSLGPTGLGIYNRADNEISVREGSTALNTMLHELAHGVQSADGASAKGANPDYIYNAIKSEVDNLPTEAKEYLNARLDVIQSGPVIKDAEQNLADSKKELENIPQSTKEWKELNSSISVEQDYLTFTKARLEEAKNKLLDLENVLDRDFTQELDSFVSFLDDNGMYSYPTQFSQRQADEMYLNETGEYLARKAEGRRQMSAEDRRTYFPFKDAPEKPFKQQDLIDYVGRLSAANMKYRSNGFAEGGMVMDQQMTPPPGATEKEVADDQPILASEGEYVIPADVVRMLGLDYIEKMVAKAKEKLAALDEAGRIGGDKAEAAPAEEPPPNVPMMAEGGLVEGTPAPTSSPDAFGTGVSGYTGVKQMQGPAGNIMYIPFFDGQPVYPIPDGYSEVASTAQAPASAKAKPKAADPLSATSGWADDGNSTADDDKERKAANDQMQTSLAGDPRKWSADTFVKYGNSMGSPLDTLGRGFVQTVMPGGMILTKARDNFLKNNIPDLMKNMLETGVDPQGNPISAEQRTALLETQNKLADKYAKQGSSMNPLDKIRGFVDRITGKGDEPTTTPTASTKSTPTPAKKTTTPAGGGNDRDTTRVSDYRNTTPSKIADKAASTDTAKKGAPSKSTSTSKDVQKSREIASETNRVNQAKKDNEKGVKRGFAQGGLVAPVKMPSYKQGGLVKRKKDC